MLHWFIGWDPRDDLAARIAVRSAKARSRVMRNGNIQVHFLKDHILRRGGFYWRPYEVKPSGQIIDNIDGKPCSTQFSFSRFCVPEIARSMNINDPVLFTDPDILLRWDIVDLFKLWEPQYNVMCVKHEHIPREDIKMDGVEQTRYFRKNWSSVMLIDPTADLECDLNTVNSEKGAWLHALMWAGGDEKIGALPKEWNHLVGYDANSPNAKLAHFTLGTPDMVCDDSLIDQEHAHEWWSYVRFGESETIPYAPRKDIRNEKLEATANSG